MSYRTALCRAPSFHAVAATEWPSGSSLSASIKVLYDAPAEFSRYEVRRRDDMPDAYDKYRGRSTAPAMPVFEEGGYFPTRAIA